MTSWLDKIPEYKDRMVLAGYMGSISHGTTSTETDDKDVMCVVWGDRSSYLGLNNFEGFRPEITDGWDICGYELRKFVRLCLKGNPNVIGLLWLEPNYYLEKSLAGEALIANRHLFSAKSVYQSFVGYARGQMHKMTAFQKYEGYMGAKRKALVDEFGYDCKNAAHLIRLLRMGIEFLSTGEFNVFRHDNNMLMDIKRGRWSLAEVKAESERLFTLIDEAYVRSTLPPRPDFHLVESLLINMLEGYLWPQTIR